jgi:hypothetical protein
MSNKITPKNKKQKIENGSYAMRSSFFKGSHGLQNDQHEGCTISL